MYGLSRISYRFRLRNFSYIFTISLVKHEEQWSWFHSHLCRVCMGSAFSQSVQGAGPSRCQRACCWDPCMCFCRSASLGPLSILLRRTWRSIACNALDHRIGVRAVGAGELWQGTWVDAHRVSDQALSHIKILKNFQVEKWCNVFFSVNCHEFCKVL